MVVRTAAIIAFAAEPTWHLEPAPRAKRRESGRAALRLAAQVLGADLGSAHSNARGAVTLPPGLHGSVSHTRGVSVAAVFVASETTSIGIDVERNQPARQRIEERVATATELSMLHDLDEGERWPALLRMFCAKEAGFKALDAFVSRQLSFQELELKEFRTNTALSIRVLSAPQLIEATVATAQDNDFTTAVAISGRAEN